MLALDQIGKLHILFVKRAGRVYQQDHHFGKFNRTQAIGHGQFFQFFRDPRLAPHTGRIP